MKNLNFLLKVISALLISVCIFSCSQNNAQIKPPRGYLNETFLKVAYATKMLKLIDTEPAVPNELKVYKGLEYKRVDSVSLQLDLYRHKELKEIVPVLIFIHGGSWSKGKRSDYLPYLVDYAMKGYVTATVSYRLSGVAKYPAALEYVKCAIKWIKDHAEEFGIDPKRVALIGGSAGGHLAMMAGYDNNKTVDNLCESESDTRVKAIVNLYGPTDLTTEYAREIKSVSYFLGKTWQEAPELFFNASPKSLISSDDPPTLTFHGTLDSLVPVSQSDSLNSWLNQAGVVSEYHRLKGWPHTMDLAQKVNKYCQYHIDEFLKANL